MQGLYEGLGVWDAFYSGGGKGLNGRKSGRFRVCTPYLILIGLKCGSSKGQGIG